MSALLSHMRTLLQELLRRPAFLPLLAVASLYLLAFVPANLGGARDPEMLAAFQLDEYVQFGVLSRMLTLKPSALATLVDFVVYRHYYYGYPFYLASALFVAPLWVVTGFASPAEHTTLYMLALRLMSAVGVIISSLLTIWMWDGLRSRIRAVLFFLFFGLAPAVFYNNTWWHPDGLIALLVTLTIFALHRDNLRFGRWFVAAAVFCGLAASTKVVGLFFFLTIAVYLLLGQRQGRLTWRQLLLKGALFTGVMALAIIVSNPLLLIPRTSRQIIGTMVLQATTESQRGSGRGPLVWYDEQLRGSFGYWWLYLAALAATLYALIRSPERRLLATIVLTWAFPFTIYCLTVVTFKKAYYFIPILLPLYASILNPELWPPRRQTGRRAMLGFALALVALYASNLPLYLGKAVDIYRYNLVREAESPSLAFYRELEGAYLAGLPAEAELTIFRDPYIYVPPGDAEVHMKWGAATYADIAGIGPDLILLQQSNIERYGADEAAGAAGADVQSSSWRFYDDARRDALAGYRRLLATDFGVAFVRSGPTGAAEVAP